MTSSPGNELPGFWFAAGFIRPAGAVAGIQRHAPLSFANITQRLAPATLPIRPCSRGSTSRQPADKASVDARAGLSADAFLNRSSAAPLGHAIVGLPTETICPTTAAQAGTTQSATLQTVAIKRPAHSFLNGLPPPRL